MAFVAKTARSLACSECQEWALRRLLIVSNGGSACRFVPTLQPRRATRLFNNHTRNRDEARERAQQAGTDDLSSSLHKYLPEERLEVEDSTSFTPSQPEPDVPWYLQIEPPIQPQENALSARQKIPELPDHSPPVLESLLQHVSVELGMDDLSLLDLRGIDPPPALGANLIMVVGTARSEKHLHFSADKLCRWLRSEHRLTPFADGLLGRQELKVKMRRRAKRSRLLSAVGAKATANSELDEGIRTGWICVNVGRVEGGELPKTEDDIQREKEVVGFGTGVTGSNVVVQLLTEDKRGEIELERLWMAVLKKTTREKEMLLAGEDAEGRDTKATLQDVHSAGSHELLGSPTQRSFQHVENGHVQQQMTTR